MGSLTLDRAVIENAEAMIRVLSACSFAGSLLFAVSNGRAAPTARPNERSSRLVTGLESADPAVRRDAITKLVTDRDPAAVAQLALALEGDDDEAVRQAAASGLGELADKRGIGALRRCLHMEQSQVVKRRCGPISTFCSRRPPVPTSRPWARWGTPA